MNKLKLFEIAKSLPLTVQPVNLIKILFFYTHDSLLGVDEMAVLFAFASITRSKYILRLRRSNITYRLISIILDKTEAFKIYSSKTESKLIIPRNNINT